MIRLVAHGAIEIAAARATLAVADHAQDVTLPRAVQDDDRIAREDPHRLGEEYRVRNDRNQATTADSVGLFAILDPATLPPNHSRPTADYPPVVVGRILRPADIARVREIFK